MVFIGFHHWRMNIKYWLQYTGKTGVQGINHKLLVPRETLQNLVETQATAGACSRRHQETGPGAARPLPLTDSRPESKDKVTTNNTIPWTSCHAVPGGEISKRTVEETRDAAGEAPGAALLPCPPVGTLLWLMATAPGSTCG